MHGHTGHTGAYALQQTMPSTDIRTHTRASKVLPRRMSAILSSLKLAKYSSSAAVLSKLPTQARKRHQLPGRGVGRPAVGKGLCVPHPCGQLGGPTTEGVQEHSELWSLTPSCGHEVRPQPHDGVDDAEHPHFLSTSLCGNHTGSSDSESGEGAKLSPGPGAGAGHGLGQTRLHGCLGQHSVGRKTRVSLEPLRPNRDQCGVLLWRQREVGVPLGTPL